MKVNVFFQKGISYLRHRNTVVLMQILPLWILRLLRAISSRAATFQDRKYLTESLELLAKIQPSLPSEAQVFVFVPGINWQTELFQRPHHLAQSLAQNGAVVFYLQALTRAQKPKIEQIQPGLFLAWVPVGTFKNIQNAIYYVLTWNAKYLQNLPAPRVIYDFVDEIEVFYGSQKLMRADHRMLLRKSELVLASARRLMAQVQAERADVIYAPNAVDYEHFAGAGHLPVVSETLSALRAFNTPIVGYYGALARWLDYELVRAVAQMRPGLSFVLIGTDYDGSLPKSGLCGLDNVYWLPPVDYQVLPGYLACFDVAMIPFIVNGITHATSPLKLFEYFAGGKPVIVTPMQESIGYAGVLVADSPAAFAAQIDTALKLANNPAYLAEINRVGRENTWEMRARQILAAIL